MNVLWKGWEPHGPHPLKLESENRRGKCELMAIRAPTMKPLSRWLRPSIQEFLTGKGIYNFDIRPTSPFILPIQTCTQRRDLGKLEQEPKYFWNHAPCSGAIKSVVGIYFPTANWTVALGKILRTTVLVHEIYCPSLCKISKSSSHDYDLPAHC